MGGDGPSKVGVPGDLGLGILGIGGGCGPRKERSV